MSQDRVLRWLLGSITRTKRLQSAAERVGEMGFGLEVIAKDLRHKLWASLSQKVSEFSLHLS
jgi:hypothetical protein